MPFISLFLRSESAVIQTTAEEAFLYFIVSWCTEHGLPYGIWWQHRPGTFSWSQESVCATDLSIISSGSMAMNTKMPSGSSINHGHPNGLLWKHRPQTSIWPLLFFLWNIYVSIYKIYIYSQSSNYMLNLFLTVLYNIQNKNSWQGSLTPYSLTYLNNKKANKFFYQILSLHSAKI